jgi:transcriptional regulator with XRE-family HTH domain
MSKKDNDALRQKKNEHFIRAFNYVATARNMNQGELATAIGSKSAYISGYKSGIRPVTDEVIEGLVRESCVEPSQQIYREYLLGNSDIMLLANVTDKELAEVELRRNNPDYDTIQQRLRDSGHNIDTQLSQSLPPTSTPVDSSSAINAAIAAYVELTNRLKQEMADRLADKDTIIAEKQSRIVALEQTISDKDAIIRARDARILELERRIAQSYANDLTKYPFSIGAAEQNETLNTK